ncbi:MAG: ABC transporter permease [Nocardioidaceae bacterium]|nr:ABC transporter permease [Nocardioidaceae bacterium]
MGQPVRVVDAPLAAPFSSAGLVDVFRRRYLLRLLVRKEISARYQGSLLGLLWSYVQPLVRFCMYFFVIGLVLGLHKNVPNFAIHMFSALVAVHYFTETFSNGTRSIVRNRSLVRKMAMPREMFPVSSCIVSAINSFPQLLILFVACVAVGWSPDAEAILAGILGIAIVTVLGVALALLFSAMNVFFRDFQNIVATFQLFTHWIVPMIYPYSKLAESSLGSGWFYYLYMSNPLTVAVLLVERCFWVPTALGQGTDPKIPADQSQVGFPVMPDHLMSLGWFMLFASLVILVLCQLAFRRLEGKFAERL